MQRREKGTGTIVQRESGTWSGRVSIGCGDDGKIKYKYFSGKTEAEVKRKIREYNKSGSPVNPQQTLLKDYLMNLLMGVKRISLKPSTEIWWSVTIRGNARKIGLGKFHYRWQNTRELSDGFNRYGQEAEFVDSLDSGSNVHCGRAGSSPARPPIFKTFAILLQ